MFDDSGSKGRLYRSVHVCICSHILGTAFGTRILQDCLLGPFGGIRSGTWPVVPFHVGRITLPVGAHAIPLFHISLLKVALAPR